MIDSEIMTELEENSRLCEIDKTQLNLNILHMSQMLKGEMGKDIKAVTSGQVKVKLSFKEKLSYFFNKIFKAF